jgi:hypothetical protein
MRLSALDRTAVLPPLVAWLGALGLLLLVAALSGFSPWHAGTWARWDSALYEDIARHGYTLVRCPTDADPDAWCGNAGWFPGYPWIVAGLSAPGLPVAGVAVAVSWLFAGATLVLLWFTFLEARLTWGSAAVLAYAACAPGLIYDYAIYPLSMLAFFTVAYLWCLYRGRWLLAGAAGAAAVLAYPIGLVLPVVAVVWIALTVDRGRGRAIVSSVAGPALAVLVLSVVQRVETGRWDAYLKVQAKYGHGLHEPLGQIWNALVPLTRGEPFTRANAPALQTLLVSAVLLAALVQLAVRRREATRLDGLIALWAVTAWVLPLTAAHLSIWRSEAALLPLALLVGRMPRPVSIGFAAAAAVVAVPVAVLYLHGRLV